MPVTDLWMFMPALILPVMIDDPITVGVLMDHEWKKEEKDLESKNGPEDPGETGIKKTR